MLDRLSATAILVHVNSDKPDGKLLRDKYHVKGLPTVIVFDSKGEEAARLLGYPGRSRWTKTILGYLYGIDTLQDLQAREAEAADRATELALANTYLDRGDDKAALAWVGKATSATPAPDAPTLASLELTRGVALLGVEPAKGVEALGGIASDASNPHSEEAYYELLGYHRSRAKSAATTEEKAKAQADMLALYHRVMPARQNDPSFLNDYAWHCAEQKVELDQALAAAQKAVELSKGDPGILDTLAEVYYTMGRRQEAVATIDKAIAQKPDDSYFKDQRAKFLSKDGEKTGK